MAERRMFARTVIDADAFLELPPSAQLLYFHLAMRADDDGFVNKPRTILRIVGGSEGDLQALIGGNLVIPFESGVIAIRHWKIHNYIRKDTYMKTLCKEEMAQLTLDENNAYAFFDRDASTQDRLGKDRLGKDRLGKDREDEEGRRFTPPSRDEVTAYCLQRGKGLDADRFYDYYECRNWKAGKSMMRDWKAAVCAWERKEAQRMWKSNPFLEMAVGEHE